MMLSAFEISEAYSVDIKDVSMALDKLDSKQCVLFAMSGKMGSGKDTIGDLISKRKELEKYDITQTSYAAPLRREITEIIRTCDYYKDLDFVADKFNVTVDELSTLKEILGDNSIFNRTSNARQATQYWGTDVRRKQDVNYWVNKTVELIIEQINNDKSVYVTDVRFINEAEAILDLGGTVVRLELPDIVRIERILDRDDVEPTYSQLTHHSELGLDTYVFPRMFDAVQKPKDIAKSAVKYILNK